MKAYHLIVKGKVQGVFYRASVKEKARRLGISGTVKNSLTGDVEVFCVGPEPNIYEFIDECKNNPGYSEVTEVFKEEIKTPDKVREIESGHNFRIIQ